MKRALKRLLSAILAILILSIQPTFAAQLHTRESIREAWRAINAWSEESPYILQPQASFPYEAGELSGESMDEALRLLNFIRWLAYLEEPVSLSRIYNYQCQHGAVLLAALDYVDHNAPRPADMDGNFYDSAHIATISGNIAKFNWMRPSILRDAVEYFVRDDGDANLPMLGHRRWALNPLMSATGFGLANSKTGMSYAVMYAHDLGNKDVQWSEVCWPSQGSFPADLMHGDLAWSITLNPGIYDLSTLPTISLYEETSGMRFHFDLNTASGDGFCAVNFDGYGAGPCLIFRPNFSDKDFTDYLQNQRWVVSVNGLFTHEGKPADLNYQVDMISLKAQDPVNVEISQLEATLHPGEALKLSAQVIPAYADDLTIQWMSSDESVASVDENGNVTALASGKCEIHAVSVNGRSDYCELTVE